MSRHHDVKLPWSRTESRFLPQAVPLPDSGVLRQSKTQLMRQHQNLSPMMGLVGEHVGEHGCSRRPGSGPTAAPKFRYPPLGADRQGVAKHTHALRRALRMRRGSLRNGAARRIQRGGTFQMRRRPLQPNQPRVMQVGKDRGDGPPTQSGPRQIRPPGARIKMGQQPLVHGIVDRVCFYQHGRQSSRGIIAVLGRTCF